MNASRPFVVGDRVESRIKLFRELPRRRGVITEVLPPEFANHRRTGPVRVQWDGGLLQLCDRRDLRRLP